MFGRSLSSQAGIAPRALAEHGQERRHERQPHDQRVGEDRDAEQQPELLRHAVRREQEREEHRRHDQRGGDDHAADAGDAVLCTASTVVARGRAPRAPAHQEHLVVHREAEEDRERDRRHEALDRAGAVEPDQPHAVTELYDEREHAEADERRQERRQRGLDCDHRGAERHRQHEERDADDVEQEPRRVREDPIADVGERGVRARHVRVRARALERLRDHRVPELRDDVVGLRVLRLVLPVRVDDRDRRRSAVLRVVDRLVDAARRPGTCFSAASSLAAASWSDCMSTTTGIGSVKPGPKPVDSRS